jgi:hypothetical protein
MYINNSIFFILYVDYAAQLLKHVSLVRSFQAVRALFFKSSSIECK